MMAEKKHCRRQVRKEPEAFISNINNDIKSIYLGFLISFLQKLTGAPLLPFRLLTCFTM